MVIITSLLALSLFATVGATPLSTIRCNSSQLKLAPVLTDGHVYGSLNDSYIVVLKDSIAASVVQNHLNFLQAAHSSDPLIAEVPTGLLQVYDSESFTGYHARLSHSLVERVRAQPEVKYIELDQVVKTAEYAVHEISTMGTQKYSTWGLARISHRERLRFSTFNKYLYAPQGGLGVDVYVIDTGINVDHVDFGGRAYWGTTIPEGDSDDDGNGHGTHVAGTIAGSTYGVAKGANVIAVKSLGSNGQGSMSDVIAGVVYATKQATVKARLAEAEVEATGRSSHKGSVVNMSIGGGQSAALNTAVDNAVDAGLHFAVAAGNDNRDACLFSPASAANAITVAASTLGDERASFSNYGDCVDVFGPGMNILSTYVGSHTATARLSGTSMASPHVAGLLAYFLSVYPHATFNPSLPNSNDRLTLVLEAHNSVLFAVLDMVHILMSRFISLLFPVPQFTVHGTRDVKTLDPVQLKAALLGLATKGKLEDVGSGSPNLLIFNNATILA